MIKLYEADREAIMNYISDEPEFNLFMIGDIENFGIDSEHVELFAHPSDSGFDSMLLRYRDSFVLYSKSDTYDSADVAAYLKKQNVQFINGKASVLERIVPYFPEMNVKRSYLSKLQRVENACMIQSRYTVRALTPDDAETIVGLFLLIDEFRDSYYGREKEQTENIKVNFETAGKGYGAFDGDRLVGVVSIAASNSMSAMVIGVATHPDYRKQGIASALVAALCTDCIESGMQFLCLFYDNPEAGSIYRKIGFREMGGYILMTPKH